jgi:hypothetical protein
MKPSFSVAMWLQKVACIELSDSMINDQANSIRTGIGSAIVETRASGSLLQPISRYILSVG